MMQILLSVTGFLLFVGLVLIHEWGHFLAARRNGVEVEEFGLGLPPRALGKKTKSGMLLSLNWLPLGGFVKLKGEHDDDDHPGSFGAARLWPKTKIMLAGITMNLLAGVVILTLLAFVGLPKLINQDTVGQDQFSVKRDEHKLKGQAMIYEVLPGSPAATAGLVSRDIIESISAGGQTALINSSADLKTATAKFAGQRVDIKIKHAGVEKIKIATLLSSAEVEASQKTDNPRGHLGVRPTSLEISRYTWSAPVVAVGFTGQLAQLTAKGLWHAISGLGRAIAGLVTANQPAREKGQTQASEQVGGPVAIAVAIWNSGSLGINFMLMLVAIISLTLAFINILPIPALDGGRLFLIGGARALRKKLTPSVEEAINGIGLVLILILAILITLVDVRRYL